MGAGPLVLSIGNMLVEVMRPGVDEHLDRPGAFIGPYPSGDTPIYIDTVARLGCRAAFIGVVGDDDFGRCIVRRLQGDGVDVTGVAVTGSFTTGVAFVAYFSDGSRRFLYHWRHAAAGQLAPEHVDANLVAGARWLHITGCNLAVCDSARRACLYAMSHLRPDALVSFDPNIRPEVLGVAAIRSICAPAIERADVLFPSVGEAAMLTGQADDHAACQAWAAAGKTVVLKRGPAGCTLYRGDLVMEQPGYPVAEVDPTGAGDSFCGAVTVAMLEGLEAGAMLRFANAVGALAVQRRGPMEGAPTRAEVNAFLSSASRQA